MSIHDIDKWSGDEERRVRPFNLTEIRMVAEGVFAT
jgi:hypothetical protein